VSLAQEGTTMVSTDGLQSKLWDVATGQLRRNFEGGLIAVSADGQRVLAGGYASTVRLWDTATGGSREAFPARAPSRVISLAFMPQGARALATSGNNIELWDADAGKLLQTFEGHSSLQKGVAWSADGRRLVSASYDKTVRVWDTATGQTVTLLNENAEAIAISGNGDRIVSADLGKQVAKLWDSTGKLLRELPGDKVSITSLAFSADGTRIATGGSEGNVILWHAVGGERLVTLSAGSFKGITAVSFSPDGARVVAGDKNGGVYVWNATSGERLRTFEESVSDPGRAHFSPNGSSVFADTGKVWDSVTGQLRHDFKKPMYTPVVFSRDGRHKLTGQDKSVVLWDVETGKEIRRFDYPPVAATVGFSPDGALAMAGGWGWGTIDVWDVASGQRVHQFTSQASLTLSVAISADGSRFAAGGYDSSLTFWNTKTGELIRTSKLAERTDEVLFSLDGSRVISRGYYEKCPDPPYCRSATTGNRTRLWHTESGRPLGTFESGGYAFSPDTRLIATGTTGTAVQLSNVADGAAVRTLLGAAGTAVSVAFSSDSRRVLSGDKAGTLTVWEVGTGSVVRSIRAHEGTVISAAFSPDGTRLVSTGNDRVTKIWKLETGELLATLVEDGEWIAFTPEGFYEASPAGARLLSVVKGMRLVEPNDVRNILHRPDLVKEKLAGDPAGAVQAAAAKLRFQ
jgi:WD40 repeat protein